MKVFALLLVVVSLIVGILSAATAYHVSLDLPDAELASLRLNAPAAVRHGDGRVEVIAPADTLERPSTLTPEVVARLRDAGVERVRVKEFSFARWPGRWVFLVSCAGLVAGGLMLRRTGPAAAPGAVAGAAADPRALLVELREKVGTLAGDLEGMTPGPARTAAIVERLGALTATHAAGIVEARGAIVRRLGMAGYAQFMERFAAAERQLNRAWSAAADEVDEEAVACVRRGVELLDEAMGRFPVSG